MAGNFRGANFSEKSDKAPRINFHGFKFCGCNPVYKHVALHQQLTNDVINGFSPLISRCDLTFFDFFAHLCKIFGEIVWTRVSLELKVPSAG